MELVYSGMHEFIYRIQDDFVFILEINLKVILRRLVDSFIVSFFFHSYKRERKKKNFFVTFQNSI